ncbi:MAG: chorismate-binding protein [Puniceicoccales bacterium]|nr:chorismate-binding protein [Puniceicoccales bacterium]
MTTIPETATVLCETFRETRAGAGDEPFPPRRRAAGGTGGEPDTTAAAGGEFARFEHPDSGFSLTAAGALWKQTFAGANRFADARAAAAALLRRTRTTFAGTAAAGAAAEPPFAPPVFIAAFPFEDGAPGTLFLPRTLTLRAAAGGATWRVSCRLADEPAQPMTPPAPPVTAEGRGAAGDAAAGGDAVATALREIGGDWFAPAVRHVLADIAAGALQKVVLARAWDAVLAREPDSVALLDALRRRFPACHSFALATGGAGDSVLVGSSPEQLVEIRDGKLFTEAVAGSAPRATGGGSEEADAAAAAALLRDPKERGEHALVVAGILDALGALGLDAAAGGTRTVTLRNVHHLRTEITASPPPVPPPAASTATPPPVMPHILDAAAVLHPTPSTGGAPRAAALSAIRALEPAPRGLFAGPLGWFDAAGAGRLVVALRCAEITGRRAVLRAGAGIVAGAEPAREDAETLAKLRAVADALDLAA